MSLFPQQKNRKEINTISPGTASFDIDEMPWSKDTLSEDVLFMTETIKKATAADILRKLEYHPNLEIIIPWLDQFLQMIWKLDKSYLYGEEERINEIPPQFLSAVNDLIQSGEAERIELTGTLKQRIEEGEKHVRQADSGNYQK